MIFKATKYVVALNSAQTKPLTKTLQLRMRSSQIRQAVA